jgi:class 3 adenylate cyclase
MPELPTGTVTFLFTDIEGSTQLLQQQREHYGGPLDASWFLTSTRGSHPRCKARASLPSPNKPT